MKKLHYFALFVGGALALGSALHAAPSDKNVCTYKYDEIGRLSSVSYSLTPEKNELYKYDSRSNIIEKRVGDAVTSYEYDGANQLLSMKSAEGLRTFKYDKSGRLVEELLDGKTVASYKYGYLDKVTEVNRNGKITKFKYDGFGMLAQKTFHDGKTEDWVWDGMALVMRGNDIYVNEPHVSGGTPLLTKTDKGVRYHTSDFLGTTLWSTDTRGKALDSYADTSVFGEGSIQQDRSARFTGKPYDEDLQAYVFPYRNYDPKLARWTSSDPSGFPDGINQHYYACVPTMDIDPLGLCTYVLGVRVYTCGVHKTDSGSGTKDMGEVDRVKFGCGGATTESHTTSSQSGGSFGINIPAAWGTINASVNYSATASKTRTYENHASCENPSAEHEVRGEGYIGIHLYVDYNWTATLYECGESDYSITNVKSYIGDNGWTTISTCVER